MVSVSLKDYEVIQKHNINMNILFLPEKDIPVLVTNVKSTENITMNFQRQMLRRMVVAIDTDRTSLLQQMERSKLSFILYRMVKLYTNY